MWYYIKLYNIIDICNVIYSINSYLYIIFKCQVKANKANNTLRNASDKTDKTKLTLRMNI